MNLAKSLKGGLLTYEATQHTVFLQGNSCVDERGRHLPDRPETPEGRHPLHPVTDPVH